ncbi:MAG TPA: Asp-tRNA(Asn)/Glu-tRNA(Gln) amidotransferase subunit GatC [Armatimonadota bacterium]|jgi:aspartyl-tRNA(Asn)/glutamyl-tRNA(Gln) amidotransferase subunit C
MANITRDEVARVGILARLDLTPEEVDQFTHQLDDILGHFKQLQAVGTEGVSPTSHAIALSNVLREDVVRPSMERGDLLAAAPDARNGCFVVPRIVDTD